WKPACPAPAMTTDPAVIGHAQSKGHRNHPSRILFAGFGAARCTPDGRRMAAFPALRLEAAPAPGPALVPVLSDFAGLVNRPLPGLKCVAEFPTRDRFRCLQPPTPLFFRSTARSPPSR